MTASFRDRATRGFAWNHLYKITEYGLLNLFNVLIIRQFGPELTAPYAVYLSIGATLMMLAAFAVDGVLLRFVPQVFDGGTAKVGEELLSSKDVFLHRLLALKLIVVAVIVLLTLLILWVLPSMSSTLANDFGTLTVLWPYLVVFLLSQTMIAFCTFTLMGLLQVKWVFFSSAISRTLLILAGIAILSMSALTLENAIRVHTAAMVLHAIVLMWYLNREVYGELIPRAITRMMHSLRLLGRELKYLLTGPRAIRALFASSVISYGITTWGSDILSTVLGRQPDILMMRGLLGEHSAEIGYYQVGAMVILMAEYALLFGLGGALVSVFSTVARNDESERSNGYPRLARARKEIAGFQLVATSPLFAYLICFASPFILAIFGNAYAPVAPMVQVGMVILLLCVGFIGGGMHVTSLVVIGKERLVFKIRLVWGIVNLVTNYFLIVNYGAIGALIGTQVCNMTACATEGYFADRLIGVARDYSAIAKVFLASFGAAALSLVAVSYVSSDVYLQTLLGAFLTATLYLGFAKGLNIREAHSLLQRLRQLLSKSKSAGLSTPTLGEAGR